MYLNESRFRRLSRTCNSNLASTVNQIEVRPMRIEDQPFIFASWLNNYKNSSQFAKRIRNPEFFHFHHLVIERILLRSTTRVLIATPENDPNTILGYLVTESHDRPILHFCFVKATWRRLGVAGKLIESANVDLNNAVFTHWTYECNQLTEKFPQLVYNPYLI